MTQTFFEKLTAIRTTVHARHARFLGDLESMVRIETPSTDQTQLRQFADHLIDYLQTELNESATVERIAQGPLGETLRFDIPGDLPGRVVMVGHYDTVWPVGTIDEFPFEINDGIVRGPGVLDMKAGLVTGIQAIKLCQEFQLPHPSITFISNGDEELGSIGSRPVIEQYAQGALAGLVLEPGVDWDLKTERKGVGIFTVTVRGIESHAGNAPTEGASAVHGLAEIITQLAALADLKHGTSTNVGTITGGTANNVLAAHAECIVDVRVTTEAEMRRIEAGLQALTTSDPRLEITLEGGWNRPAMPLRPATTELFQRAQTIAKEVRKPLGQRSVGGGSDGNFIAAMGIPVLDGLGSSGNGPHARSEHILESDIDDRIMLLCGILTECLR